MSKHINKAAEALRESCRKWQVEPKTAAEDGFMLYTAARALLAALDSENSEIPNNPALDQQAQRSEGVGELASLVRKRLRQYDSLRDAGKKLGMCHVYLHRLAAGKKTNPSDDALRKLGITRTVRIIYKETSHD